MRRLFLLSISFSFALGLFLVGFGSFLLFAFSGASRNLNAVVAMLHIIIFTPIGGSGVITLGVMLVKHIRDIFKGDT